MCGQISRDAANEGVIVGAGEVLDGDFDLFDFAVGIRVLGAFGGGEEDHIVGFVATIILGLGSLEISDQCGAD